MSTSPKIVIIYCEGQTEEHFIKEILAPYFEEKQIILSAKICNTESKGSGGVSKYSKIKGEIEKLCGSNKHAIITTMLDYYGLPKDTEGYIKNINSNLLTDDISKIEKAIFKDIRYKNFIPNLILHEFEGLLFSKPEAFSCISNSSQKKINELGEIKKDFPTPEHINNSFEKKPSARIENIYPSYKKIIDGITIAKKIGIENIRKECPHFEEWLKNIEEKCAG